MRYSIPLAGVGLGVLLALGACDKLKSSGVEQAATDMGTDTCGAVSHQWLVGNSAAQLDAAKLPKGTQVIFPGMRTPPVSKPSRMTVVVGGGDEVTRVFCG